MEAQLEGSRWLTRPSGAPKVPIRAMHGRCRSKFKFGWIIIWDLDEKGFLSPLFSFLKVLISGYPLHVRGKKWNSLQIPDLSVAYWNSHLLFFFFFLAVDDALGDIVVTICLLLWVRRSEIEPGSSHIFFKKYTLHLWCSLNGNHCLEFLLNRLQCGSIISRMKNSQHIMQGQRRRQQQGQD